MIRYLRIQFIWSHGFLLFRPNRLYRTKRHSKKSNSCSEQILETLLWLALDNWQWRWGRLYVRVMKRWKYGSGLVWDPIWCGLWCKAEGTEHKSWSNINVSETRFNTNACQKILQDPRHKGFDIHPSTTNAQYSNT